MASRLLPVMMATGSSSPSAHGHAVWQWSLATLMLCAPGLDVAAHPLVVWIRVETSTSAAHGRVLWLSNLVGCVHAKVAASLLHAAKIALVTSLCSALAAVPWQCSPVVRMQCVRG